MMKQIAFAPQRAYVVSGGRHAAEAKLARDLAEGWDDTVFNLACVNEVKNLSLARSESFHTVMPEG